MNGRKRYLALFLLCSGCAGGQGAAAVDPVALAGRYAKAHGTNLSEYEVRSVSELEQGQNLNVDLKRSDEYANHFLGKLRGKHYWEVCYRTIERMLGGDECYYIDKDSKKLLVVYRGQ